MSKKAIIYVRVSSREQIENTSLESQEASCREWCTRNDALVERVFKEMGESARTTDRTQFQAMFRYLETHFRDIDYLVVHKFDRFGRKAEEDIPYKALLRRRLGIKIVSATEPTDDTPSGRFLEHVLGAVAELDNDVRAMRAKDGMMKKASEGRFVWRAPLGYKNGRTRKEPSLLIDQTRANLIKRFFESVASGKRVSDALAEVNALGLRTLENRPVTPWTAKKWLNNVVYCGYVRSDEWGLLVKGDFEPIIDEGLFTRVRDVLTGRASPFTPHQRSNPVYPLKGVVMCPSCGKPVTASASKSENGNYFAYYHCHRERGHFRQSAAVVESNFLELLDRLQPEPRREELIATVFRRVWDEKEAYVVRDREMMQAELKKLEGKKRRLIDDRAAGVLDAEDIAEPLREVKDQIDSIKFRLATATHASIDVDIAINYLLHTLWNSRNLWEVMDLQARQRLAKLIFPAGIIPSDSGFGTPTTSSIFLSLATGDAQIENMVRPERFELPT